MNNQKLVVLALPLVLAVGFAAGVLFGRSDPVHAAGASDIEARAARPAADPRGVDTLVAPSSAPTASGGTYDPGALDAARAERAAGAAVETARRAAADAAPSEIDGDGVVRGRIVAEDGTPIPGATVALSTYTSWQSRMQEGNDTSDVGRGWKGFGDLEETLAKTAEATLKTRRNTRTVQADADGAFVAEGLADRRFQVTGHAEGYHSANLVTTPGREVELVLELVSLYHLEPRLPDGSTPETARAVVHGVQNRIDTYRWTPEEPVLRLEGRVLSISMQAGEAFRIDWRTSAAAFEAPARTIDLDQAGEGPHVFELVEVPLLRVTVRQPGLQIEGFDPWVEARPVGSDEAQALELLPSKDYLLSGAKPGTYEVTAGRLPGEVDVTQNVELTSGLVELELSLPATDESAFIIAHCFGPGGAALGDIQFATRIQTASGTRSDPRTKGISRTGGVHWIPWPRPREGQEGDVEKVEVNATTKAYGSHTETAEAPGSTLEFHFQDPAEVIVQVDGDTSGSLGVMLQPQSEDPFAYMMMNGAVTEVPADGRVDLGRVQPGDYTLVLGKSQGRSWMRETYASEDVTLRSGEQVLHIARPELSDLEVRVADGVKGDRVLLRPQESANDFRRMKRATLDENGVATFEDLAAGRYRISMSGRGGQKEMDVDVPSGPIDFAPMKVTGLVLDHVSEDGDAYAWGLRKGDVIVAAGKDDKPGDQFWGVLNAETKTGPVRVQVERGSRNIDITVPESVEIDWQKLGISFSSRLE